MKKAYSKPTLADKGRLGAVTAGHAAGECFGRPHRYLRRARDIHHRSSKPAALTGGGFFCVLQVGAARHAAEIACCGPPTFTTVERRSLLGRAGSKRPWTRSETATPERRISSVTVTCWKLRLPVRLSSDGTAVSSERRLKEKSLDAPDRSCGDKTELRRNDVGSDVLSRAVVSAASQQPSYVDAAMQMEAARNRKGLMKLMLRMPALRGQLQLLSVRNEDVFNLCGAFDDASVTLERLRKSGAGPGRHPRIREYLRRDRAGNHRDMH